MRSWLASSWAFGLGLALWIIGAGMVIGQAAWSLSHLSDPKTAWEQPLIWCGLMLVVVGTAVRIIHEVASSKERMKRLRKASGQGISDE